MDKYKAQGVTDVWKARFMLMTDFAFVRTSELDLCNKQLEKLWRWDKLQQQVEKPNVP